MKINCLLELDNFIALITIVNLGLAASNTIDSYIYEKLFNIKGLKDEIIHNINLETKGILTDIGKKSDLNKNTKIDALNLLAEVIDKEYVTFLFKGFEIIYLIGGFYGLLLLYLSGININNSDVAKWIIVSGSLTIITYIFFIRLLFTSKVKIKVWPGYIIVSFIFIILVSHFFKLFIPFEIRNYSIYIHSANLLIIFPYLANAIIALFFRNQLIKKHKHLLKWMHIDIEQEIRSEMASWNSPKKSRNK